MAENYSFSPEFLAIIAGAKNKEIKENSSSEETDELIDFADKYADIVLEHFDDLNFKEASVYMVASVELHNKLERLGVICKRIIDTHNWSIE